MQLVEKKVSDFDSNFTEIGSQGSKSRLFQVMD